MTKVEIIEIVTFFCENCDVEYPLDSKEATTVICEKLDKLGFPHRCCSKCNKFLGRKTRSFAKGASK